MLFGGGVKLMHFATKGRDRIDPKQEGRDCIFSSVLSLVPSIDVGICVDTQFFL